MELRRLGSWQFAPYSFVWPEVDGWAAASPDRRLILLEPDLSDVAWFRLPEDANMRGVHGVASDGGSAVVSAVGRVALIDRLGRTQWDHPHPTWGRGDSESGSCWFSADGSVVWAHVPTEDGPDEWVVLDAVSGRLIDRAPLETYAAGSNPVRHPDGRHFGLSVGEGQDGSEIYWGSLDADRIQVSRYPDRTRVLVDVSPDGRHFLTTPHGEGPVQVHAFPGGIVVASLSPEAVFAEGDGFDIYGGFIDTDTVVLSASEDGSVVVASLDLRRWAIVPFPAFPIDGALLVAHGILLTAGWKSGVVETWELTGR